MPKPSSHVSGVHDDQDVRLAHLASMWDRHYVVSICDATKLAHTAAVNAHADGALPEADKQAWHSSHGKQFLADSVT